MRKSIWGILGTGLALALFSSPNAGYAGGPSCKATCDQYRNYKPTSDSGAQASALWGELGHHCDAVDLLDKSEDGTKDVRNAYMASALACGSACGMIYARNLAMKTAEAAVEAFKKSIEVGASGCFSAVTSSGPENPAADACAAANTALWGIVMPELEAASLKYDQADTALMAADKLSELSRVPAMTDYNASAGALKTAIVNVNTTLMTCPPCSGLDATASGVQTQLTLAQAAVSTASGAMIACEVSGLSAGMMDIVEAAKLKQGNVSKFITGSAAMGMSGALAGGVADEYVGPCTTAGVMTLAATLRYKSANDYQDAVNKECGTVTALVSRAAANDALANAFRFSPNMGAAAGGGGALGTGSTPTGSSGLNLGSNLPFPGNLMAGKSAAATAANDPFAKMFDRMPNKDKIPAQLNQLGTSVDALAGKMDSGSSPASLMSAVPNLPPALSSDLARMNMEFLHGPVQVDQTSAIASSGGGGARGSGGGSKPLDFGLGSLFGNNAGNQAGPSANALSFGRAPASAGDIWHEGYKGTIFDIVSHKLASTRERVQQLDWATPLNRALTQGSPKAAQTK